MNLGLSITNVDGAVPQLNFLQPQGEQLQVPGSQPQELPHWHAETGLTLFLRFFG